MKKFYLYLIASLFNLFSVTAQSNVTFTIDASGQDAAIDDYAPSQNNPNEIEYNTCAWTIFGTPVIWRDVFKFDLTCIPPNATIQSADLSLFYASTNNYGNTQHSSLTNSNESVLQRITSYWREDSVTWNTQPSSTNIDEVILPQSTNGTQNYLNMNVKNIVQQMVSFPNSNYGFILKLTQELYYARLIFASGDNPDLNKHPLLNIKYSIPESDCITLRIDHSNQDGAIDDYVPTRSNPNEIEYNTCAWTIFGTPVLWRDYFKFDLPCDLTPAFIQSAHLSLFYAAQNNYGNTQHSSLTSSNESVLRRATSPWTEDTVNWYNQPSVTIADQVILPQSISGTQDYLNMDVTNMVRVMMSNTNQNYGFLLKLTNEIQYARLIFASGDNPDLSKHPLLEICYSFSTAVNEINQKNNVSVFPNPFMEMINVSLDRNISDGDFSLFNSLGQVVLSKSHLSGDQFQFQTHDLSNGIYYYELMDKGNVIATGKLQEMM